MTFDVNQFVAKIEATVVPELPEELSEAKLRDHMAQRVAVAAVIVDPRMQLRFVVDCLKGAEHYVAELLGIAQYLKDVNGEKFAGFSPEHRFALEQCSAQVTLSVAVLKSYTTTLLKMQELLQCRIDLQK